MSDTINTTKADTNKTPADLSKKTETEGGILSDAIIVKAYATLSGYDPVSGQGDEGAAILDALNFWRTQGIGGHKIYAFTAVNPKNTANVKAAIYLFGGLCAGVLLPLSAKHGEVWDVPKEGTTGDGAVNSWGGHAIPVIGYDKDYVYCVTWGVKKKMTWKFWNTYCDEAYVVISKEFVKEKTPHGFDLTTLQADLKALQK